MNYTKLTKKNLIIMMKEKDQLLSEKNTLLEEATNTLKDQEAISKRLIDDSQVLSKRSKALSSRTKKLSTLAEEAAAKTTYWKEKYEGKLEDAAAMEKLYNEQAARFNDLRNKLKEIQDKLEMLRGWLNTVTVWQLIVMAIKGKLRENFEAFLEQ